MGLYLYGSKPVTNIDPNSEMADRLRQVNDMYQYTIVVVETIVEKKPHWWSRLKVEKRYTIFDDKDNPDFLVIAQNLTEREVELYLLGMINGVMLCDYGWRAKD